MRSPRIVATAAALAFALVAGACGGGGGGDEGASSTTTARDTTHQVRVMTRNLYLGADLLPLFAATAETLTATARATYDQVVGSDVENRLDAVAREIVDAKPDLVALQEATLWRQQAPGADAPSDLYDFVGLLTARLAARGATYTVAASANGFSGGLPVEGKGVVTMQDRDVILVRDGAPLSVANPATGTFADKMTVKIAGAPIEVVRGWASVDVTVAGRSFTFFGTHLEAFDDPVRDAQETELLGVIAKAKDPVLLLGDLNSAATGEDSGAYRKALDAGLEDVWPAVNGKAPGFTCCRSADVTSGTYDQRIDYVLFKGDFTPRAAEVVGNDALSRTPANRWSSDHAGVVATLEVGGR